jgi:tetratricopeptide (TPR) repeat protein
LIGLHQLDDAQVQWEGVAERYRDTAAARQTGARLALARNKPGEALTLLQPLTQGEDRQASVMALYGEALYAADQVDASAGAYDAALELDSGLPEALIGRGEVEVRAEKPDEALEHLVAAEAALKARIRPPELASRMWLLTGRAYIQRNKRGDLESARAALTQATAIVEVDPIAFFWLGESWAGKNTPEARAAYERYMTLAPEGEFAARARKALSVR